MSMKKINIERTYLSFTTLVPGLFTLSFACPELASGSKGCPLTIHNSSLTFCFFWILDIGFTFPTPPAPTSTSALSSFLPVSVPSPCSVIASPILQYHLYLNQTRFLVHTQVAHRLVIVVWL